MSTVFRERVTLKRKRMIILCLVIVFITEAILIINLLEPSLQVILTSLHAAALVSLIAGMFMLAAIYLARKLNASKEETRSATKSAAV